MKRLVSITLGTFIALLMLVGSERKAWGYVDPGSGLIALQTFASVAAAYVYVVRKKILALFARKEKLPRLPVSAKTAEPGEVA